MAMTRQEIERITNEFLIEEIEIDTNAISSDARLKEELGVDSLDFVDIVVIVERNFGFKIKAEEMAGVTTLGAFYDYIETKVNG
jgi:acyl carrier protein